MTFVRLVERNDEAFRDGVRYDILSLDGKTYLLGPDQEVLALVKRDLYEGNHDDLGITAAPIKNPRTIEAVLKHYSEIPLGIEPGESLERLGL